MAIRTARMAMRQHLRTTADRRSHSGSVIGAAGAMVTEGTAGMATVVGMAAATGGTAVGAVAIGAGAAAVAVDGGAKRAPDERITSAMSS